MFRKVITLLCLVACVALALGSAGSYPNCSNSSIGCTPLTDLGTGTYDPTGTAPEMGGLYGGGSNYRPLNMERLGRHFADKIQSDADQIIATYGSTAFVTLGHSIGKKITAELFPLMQSDPLLWNKLKLVDCCQAGYDAQDLDDITKPYWTSIVPGYLAAANVDARQVQVAWMMSGFQNPTGTWPNDAYILRDTLIDVTQAWKQFFPNLKQLYISLPIYEGYKSASPAIEPMNYEQGFGLRMLMELQANSDPRLNCISPQAPIVAPWISWGGYFWCDGVTLRNDGLNCVCPQDVDSLGVHPSPSYSNTLATMLLNEFTRDPCARPWLTGQPLPGSGWAGTSPGLTEAIK